MAIPDLNALRDHLNRRSGGEGSRLSENGPLTNISGQRLFRLLGAVASLVMMIAGPARAVWGLNLSTSSGRWVVIGGGIAFVLGLFSISLGAFVAFVSVVVSVTEVDAAVGLWLGAAMFVGILALRATIPSHRRHSIILIILLGCSLARFGFGLAAVPLLVLDRTSTGWRRWTYLAIGAFITIVAEELVVLASLSAHLQIGNPLSGLVTVAKRIGPSVTLQFGYRIAAEVFTGPALATVAACVVAVWGGHRISLLVLNEARRNIPGGNSWLYNFGRQRFGGDALALLAAAVLLLSLDSIRAAAWGGALLAPKVLVVFAPGICATALAVLATLREEGASS